MIDTKTRKLTSERGPRLVELLMVFDSDFQSEEKRNDPRFLDITGLGEEKDEDSTQGESYATNFFIVSKCIERKDFLLFL